jgi:adenylate cyclase
LKIKDRYVVLIILLLFCVISFFNSLEGLENKFRDTILESENRVDTRVVIVGIDENSLMHLGRWPWSREIHGQLIKRLKEGGAAVIGLDFLISEDIQSTQSTQSHKSIDITKLSVNDTNQDFAFTEVLEDADNVVLPLYGIFPGKTGLGDIKALDVVGPLDIFKKSTRAGHINVIPDTDGIVRKGLLSFEYQGETILSFPWLIYQEYLKNQKRILPDFRVPVDEWNRFYLDFVGGPGEVEHHSYYDILSGSIPKEYFENKIVLVGPYAPGLNDYYPTPLDYQTPMYGVEIHANILLALLGNSFKEEIAAPWLLFILFGFAAGSFFISKRYKPFVSLVIISALILSYFLTAHLVYNQGIILPLVYPTTLAVVIYLIILVYRYLEENIQRRRVTALFGRYVAPQVVEKLLCQGDGPKLGGERRVITVLFIDIRGFTSLAEKNSPEDVVSILNRYLDICTRTILKYDGTLDKFIGDAVMAVFNSPQVLEDHVWRAVQAAWEISCSAQEILKSETAQPDQIIQFGMGIHTGEAIVGNIGAEFRMDYTAIGDTVNTAARLESYAGSGEILLSKASCNEVKERVRTEFYGDLSLKGKARSVPVYKLMGLVRE